MNYFIKENAADFIKHHKLPACIAARMNYVVILIGLLFADFLLLFLLSLLFILLGGYIQSTFFTYLLFLGFVLSVEVYVRL